MHHFPWKMTDNVYEQKLGCIEEFMDQTDKSMPGPRQHLSVHGFLRLQFMPSRGGLEDRLRRAWRILRGSAPALTAVVCDGKKVLSQMCKADIDAWAEDSFIKHQESTTMESILAESLRRKYITLHFLPGGEVGRFCLAIQAGHVHFSAREIYRLFDKYLSILVNEDLTENESERLRIQQLPLQIDDMIPVSYPQSGKDSLVARDWLSILSDVDPLAIPTNSKHNKPTPLRTVRSAVSIGQEASTQLVRACRQHSITVTAAWLAAITSTLADVATETCIGPLSDKMALAGMTTLDSRSWRTDQPSPDDEVLVCSRFALTPIKLYANAPFRENAKRAMDTYHGDGILPEKGAALSSATQLLSCMLQEHPELKSIVTASYGIVDKYLKHEYLHQEEVVKVEEIWIAVGTLDDSVVMMLHTWRGQMRLSASYNEAFYCRSMVDIILARVRDTMLQNLDVNVSYPSI